MVNAIFHKGEYLLLPDAFPTFDAFMADLRSRTLPTTCRLIRLKEENRITDSGKVVPGFCTAPCFLTGYRDWYADVHIADPDDVFPVSAERIPLREYDLRLRETISRTCTGCMRCKPPTARAQTLMDYRELLSLEGVCFFRCDEKPVPRVFGNGLEWLGGGFMRLKYAEKDAETLQQHIKQELHIVYERAEKASQPDGSTLLTVTPKKRELLPPYLTLAIGHYIHGLTGSFRMASPTQPDVSPEAILALVDQGDAFRKECRKYGVSIADLAWNAHDGGRVADMLRQMNQTCLLYPLHTEPGRAILLLMNTPRALKQLRFYTPMLEAYAAHITVHGQYHSRRYAIHYDMPFETLA